MDEAVFKYYRRLLRFGFRHAGIIENPSLLLDPADGDYRICGAAGDYLHLYISIADETIRDVKYLCSCVPVTNVAIELLCSLIIARPLEQLGSLTEDAFSEELGGESQELQEKAKGLLALLGEGLARYRAGAAGGARSQGQGD